MNGFSLAAESYRELVKQGKLTQEQAQKDIEIYDFFAKCKHEDFCRMVDTAAFNDIIKAYCRKALRSAEVDKDTEDRVMDELRWLFDTMQANVVCK